MQTGDKVLLLLTAKIACCGLLVMAARGALGGVLTWLITGSVPLFILGLFAAGIIAIVWRSRPDPTDVELQSQMLTPDPPAKSTAPRRVFAERADAMLAATDRHEQSASS